MAHPKLDLFGLLPPRLVRVDPDDQKKLTAFDTRTLRGKTILLYFSAHWCPPCRAFTPHLASVYSALVARGVDTEVIFVSHDRDARSFQEYLQIQAAAGGAWAALPFDEAAAEREQLARTFKVMGIPSLAVVGPGGEVLAPNAVAAVRGDATGAGFPWEGASGPSAPPVWVLLAVILLIIYLPKILGGLWG